ncbi:MAG: hypothetical protein RR614_08460, partial [Eubacterium sp.]
VVTVENYYDLSGRYKITGVSKSTVDGGFHYVFTLTNPESVNSNWQYITVDELMIFNNTEINEIIELSSKDTVVNKVITTKVAIVKTFSGTFTCAWFQGNTEISNTRKTYSVNTGAIAGISNSTFIYTLPSAYNNSTRGDYQLRILDTTKENDTLKPKDIRGPATTVKCYDATIAGTPVQRGPSYEGTDTTITQDIISLSTDMIKDGYDAYFVKGGQLTQEMVAGAVPNTVQHAYLKPIADGGYTASATFSMKKADAGDYQLVIYPSGLTTRTAVPDKIEPDKPENLNMQFVSEKVAQITCYGITGAVYNPGQSYSSVSDLVKDQFFIEGPAVEGNNKTKTGTLSYKKTSGNDYFSVESKTGRIVCSAEPGNISNGYYTIKLEVSDTGFLSDPNNSGSPPITGPGMTYETSVSFVVTGSSDIILDTGNIYIYDGYYKQASSESEASGKPEIANTGIYNIKSNAGTSYTN